MLRSYRTDSAFSTWIYRICQNLIADFYRKSKKTQTVSLSVQEADSGGEPRETDIEDESGEPSELLIREERIKEIRRIINSLPDDLRDIIVLRDLKSLSYAQISDMLGIEIGTVKSRLNRAREKLREYILKNSRDGELL
jgi:RNA polymerase sigma-70 factor (ECF subfamily)